MNDITTFTYDSLEPIQADVLRQDAEFIRSARKRIAANVIAVGERLNAAKAKLPHGAWGTWLKVELQWSERSAQRYMRVANAFGGKSATMANLDLNALDLLAQPTKTDIREAVLEQLHAGRIDEARATIAEARTPPARKVKPERPNPATLNELLLLWNSADEATQEAFLASIGASSDRNPMTHEKQLVH